MSLFLRHGRAKAPTGPARPTVKPTGPVAIPTIDQCIRHIAAHDTDRARIENGIGFNQMDSDTGNQLAAKDFDQWHNWERKWAFKRIRFYRRQLEAGGLRWDLVPEPAEKAAPGPVKRITVTQRDYKVEFSHLGDEFDMVRAAIAMIPGRRFSASEGCWFVPRDSISAPHLMKFVNVFGFVSDSDLTSIVAADSNRSTLMQEGSRAIKPFMPFEGAWQPAADGISPWLHQEAGRAYGKLSNYRLVIADEMGTGKTGLTLIMAEDADCFTKDEQGRSGILVICPSSVKLNWKNEVRMWLPGRTATVLNGTGLQSIKGDVVIANYDILRVKEEVVDDDFFEQADLLKLLKLRKWKGIVLDECHYAKDPQAQRTMAIAAIIKATNPDLRLMLSGSPILNRLSEFVPAMNFAGVLDRFGGAAQFLMNYGGRNTDRIVEMNTKFRESGYLCRLKDHHAFTPQGAFVHIDDVPEWVVGPELRVRYDDEEQDQLNIERLRRALRVFDYKLEVGAMKLPRCMPRSIELVELSDPKEYARAEAEFRAWLWEHMMSAGADMDKWSNALKAEALLKLTKLRQLVGKLKVEACISWTKNFMESTDEKLILFVEHNDPQDRILQAFPNSCSISGDQSTKTRQEQIDRFQTDPTVRLMVAKTKAGGVGVTLTAANHVGILELPWNPGTVDQAIARAHRGGQTKTVFPHYFLAEGTIDQKSAVLIDEKRVLTTAAIHGGTVDASQSIAGALLEHLAA